MELASRPHSVWNQYSTAVNIFKWILSPEDISQLSLVPAQSRTQLLSFDGYHINKIAEYTGVSHPVLMRAYFEVISDVYHRAYGSVAK